MFKNTNSKRMTGILLALVLVTSIFIGGSIARYVTSTSSEDDARVAKWGFSETPEPVTMDLFKNEYKLDGNTVVAKSNNGDNIIAPGLNGVSKFKFVTSSVAPEVMYEVKISLDDSDVADEIKNHPGIQWKVDDGNWVTWDEMVASLVSLSGDPSGYKVYAPGELHDNFKSNVEHTIAWQWLMDAGYDEEDTAMGNLAARGEDITAKIIVTVLAQQTDVDSTGMLEGNGSVYNTNDPQPLTFRADADYETFDSVKIDGTTINSNNYDTEEGSIIVKLNKNYLKNLSKGKHTISIVTDDKEIKSNFTVTTDNTIIHNGIIPEGGIYYQGVTTDDSGYVQVGDYTNGTVYHAGEKFPELKNGDVFVYKDYEYRYNMHHERGAWESMPVSWRQNPKIQDGWGVSALLDTTKTEYAPILTTINGKNIKCIARAFDNCTNMTTIPYIPNTVEDAMEAFWFCSKLTGTIELNLNNLKDYSYMIEGTNITWITGTISDEVKQSIATMSGITLIKPAKVITDSWETIAQRVKSGKANEYYEVGDKATVKVNGEDKEVVIIDFNHDGDNTITFMFNESIASAPMNEAGFNQGGWRDSDMRNITLVNILNSMENKNLIKTVEKDTVKGAYDFCETNMYGDCETTDYEGALSLDKTSDKLFLLSPIEVHGVSDGLTNWWKDFNEGYQYEYFKIAGNKIIKSKETGNGVSWWLRTPNTNFRYAFDCVANDGFASDEWAETIVEVVPAFVIG